MRENNLRLAFLGLAGVWDPHLRPSCLPERNRMRKMRMMTRMKKRCSVMPACGPTAPPQMSQLGLRDDTEQSKRGKRQLAQEMGLLVGRVAWTLEKVEGTGGFELRMWKGVKSGSGEDLEIKAGINGKLGLGKGCSSWEFFSV